MPALSPAGISLGSWGDITPLPGRAPLVLRPPCRGRGRRRPGGDPAAGPHGGGVALVRAVRAPERFAASLGPAAGRLRPGVRRRLASAAQATPALLATAAGGDHQAAGPRTAVAARGVSTSAGTGGPAAAAGNRPGLSRAAGPRPNRGPVQRPGDHGLHGAARSAAAAASGAGGRAVDPPAHSTTRHPAHHPRGGSRRLRHGAGPRLEPVAAGPAGGSLRREGSACGAGSVLHGAAAARPQAAAERASGPGGGRPGCLPAALSQ